MKQNIGLFEKLPLDLSIELQRLTPEIQEQIQEIRIKIGHPILIYAGNKEYKLKNNSDATVGKEYINNVCNCILNHSVYAHQQDLANGFVTMEGGHRVGFCGRAVMDNGKISTLTNITSINIRKSRQIIGISEPYYSYLTNKEGGFFNTILISPPKCGKTTMLRDLIRNLSSHGFKVGVCDERSEIAGFDHFGTSFDLGMRTDILDSCPKEKAMTMLIRSMAPDIIATDEIGKESDYEAVCAAVTAGVGLLTTIHGNTYEDLIRSQAKKFLDNGIFQRIVYLGNRPKVGTVRKITDEKNQILLSGERSLA
ncbi:stage III sporulation protein AA [Sinanaerobacter sp. ZZT-01]|uniref:stage III sporulation protein AA n=1 Tax=Sinanaerobacter sp. ZZT-01 TaxID=3111540 RepID=UPI002D786C86|nr:stage III sporulation protein AA [Sinanaerobacter sp. ZZT-01]WRR93142.1 stage III sporulation protein AA [Sinanaerobacter sp. ZZT-01]